MAAPTDLSMMDIRGGMNDQDPKHIIPDDQCVLADNVEFFFSTLGERRQGMAPVDTTGAGAAARDEQVHLGLYLPELGTPEQSQLFMVGADVGSAVTFSLRSAAGAWADVSAVDAPTNTAPTVYQMRSQSIHDKWFVTYDSAEDRTHVYDGTSIRRVGLIAPTAAPTVADSGTPGAFTGDRIYRVRIATVDGATTVLLSEPSPEIAFTPSGTADGAVVTQPTLPGESETNWVIEASNGDGLWYELDSLPIATLTYTDTVEPSTDYPDVGTLSADIGEYDLVPSVKIVKADEDRVIFMGSYEDPEKGSRVYWTPPSAAPGYGNDERVPANYDSFTDLDWQVGGEITDASDPVNGAFYVFKWSRIYKAQRTGNANQAYSFYLLDPAHGALPGSVVSGVDEYGRGAVYFIDPSIGPMRISTSGVQQLQGLGTSWRRVNTNATMVQARGLYYPDKKQIHWWVPVDGANYPNFKMVSQTNQIQSDNRGGTTRGWSIVDGGAIAEAITVLTVPEEVETEAGSVQLAHRPYMGFRNANVLQRGDVGSTDNGTAYRGHIISRPYFLAGLLNKWGAMNAGLLAAPIDDASITLTINLIRDFGLETNTTSTDFVPVGSEDPVIKIFDNLHMSDARAVQVEFIDPA